MSQTFTHLRHLPFIYSVNLLILLDSSLCNFTCKFYRMHIYTIYTAYMHNIAMPSFRLMTFEVHANTRTALLIMISIRVSTILSIRNPTGLIAAAIPSTSKMLKMLEPITFPSAISTSFFSRCNNGGHKLWKTCSKCNDCKSDQCLANSE